MGKPKTNIGDRPTKYRVFLKILTNFPFPFCFAALSFLPKGIGDIFVDYIRYNKKDREFVSLMWLWVVN